jgi:hypothetical protein
MIAYHCGGDIKDGTFSLDYFNTGENFGKPPLGPGIYFATNPILAKEYCKYVGVPAFYKVEINATYDELINNRHGPERLWEIERELARKYPGRKYQLPHETLLERFGAKRASEILTEAGIKGAWAQLPGTNGIEIAVFDPSIITVLEKTIDISKALKTYRDGLEFAQQWIEAGIHDDEELEEYRDDVKHYQSRIDELMNRNPPSKTALFSYGSNGTSQLTQRLGRRIKGYQAFLEGYGRVYRGWSRNWGSGAASLKKMDKTTYGSVSYLTQAELTRLDRFEGVNSGNYKRKWVNVEVNKNGWQSVRAVAYVSTSREKNDPSQEYLEAVSRNVSEFWTGSDGSAISPEAFYNRNPSMSYDPYSLTAIKNNIMSELAYQDRLMQRKYPDKSSPATAYSELQLKEALGEDLNYNRSEIWKALKSLEEEGKVHLTSQGISLVYGGNSMRQNPIEGYLYDFRSPGDIQLVEQYVTYKESQTGKNRKDPDFSTYEEIDMVRRGVPFQQVLHGLTSLALPSPDMLAAMEAGETGGKSGRDWSDYHDFKAVAQKFGVSPRIRNKKFDWNGETYIVVGLNPRARKEPVDCKLKHSRDGVVWTFPLRTVKSQLTRAGVNWRP